MGSIAIFTGYFNPFLISPAILKVKANAGYMRTELRGFGFLAKKRLKAPLQI
jgi:hypothetical protein